MLLTIRLCPPGVTTGIGGSETHHIKLAEAVLGPLTASNPTVRAPTTNALFLISHPLLLTPLLLTPLLLTPRRTCNRCRELSGSGAARHPFRASAGSWTRAPRASSTPGRW